jgi:hypothetical protein
MKYLHKHSNNILVIFQSLFLSCATVNKPEVPGWVLDMHKIYPNEQYVAQRGYGFDHQSAQVSALEGISRYFSTHIESEMRELITVTDTGSSSILKDETFIQSQTNLFAVNYTKTWYNKSSGQWEIVAYINRNEAWELYEPELKRKNDAFRAMYDEAERKNEPFQKILFYSNANNIAIKE